MADLAETVGKVVTVPVVAAGQIATGAFAEKILAENKADIIGLARVLRTDPPQKNRSGNIQSNANELTQFFDTTPGILSSK